MATRLELHKKLVHLFAKDEHYRWDPFNFELDDVETAIWREASERVYYQPPETIKMVYPCIIYDLERDDLLHADDAAYHRRKVYSVTIVDKNPDSELPDQLSDMFNAGMERHYTADNLHHFVYTIRQ